MHHTEFLNAKPLVLQLFVHRCLWSEKGHWEFRYRRKTTRKIADIVKTYQVIKRVLEKHDFLMEFMIPPATAEIPFTKLQHTLYKVCRKEEYFMATNRGYKDAEKRSIL